MAYFVPGIFAIEVKPIDWSKISNFSSKGIFTAFGFYMLGYVQQLIVIEVDKEVIPNKLSASNKVLIQSSCYSFFLYAILSVVGYLTIYQEETKDLDNYLIFLITNEKFKSSFFLIANVLIGIGCLFGNALNFYPLVNFFSARLNK